TVPRFVVANRAADLLTAATGLSSPLVLKAFGPGIVHKSDVGAVRVGLTAAELEGAAAAMPADASGYLVEEQAAPGVELIVGVVRRPGFGLLALVGLGGTLTELVGDVCMRLCPLTAADAAE